jgi:hypothetical protein
VKSTADIGMVGKVNTYGMTPAGCGIGMVGKVNIYGMTPAGCAIP